MESREEGNGRKVRNGKWRGRKYIGEKLGMEDKEKGIGNEYKECMK